MSVILDLLISIIFGGILTLLVLNSKDVAHESLQETHAGMLVQEELTSVIQQLEGEFRNAGSGVPATVAPVVRAESTAITFLADLDGDRSAADTVSYELGKTDEMLGTPNPVDRPLYRTVNSQRLLNGSLTVLLFRYFDVGGGLAVDYDGSKTNFSSSANYSIEEYASDVVSSLAETCEQEQIPHPNIISESGRALVAYHSILVFNVLGTSRLIEDEEAAKLVNEEELKLQALRNADSASNLSSLS